MQKDKNKRKGQSSFSPKVILSFLLVLVLFILFKQFRGYADLGQIFDVIKQSGFWAPLFYVIIYILISGIIVPSIVVKILAGTLFGIGWGIILVSVASSISSAIKFILARYFFRERIQRKIQSNEKLRTIDQAIEADGWKMLLMLRNVPVFNCMLLNYICGITKMKFRHFIIVSFIGRLPVTVLYVYMGYIVRFSYKLGKISESNRYAVHNKAIFFLGLISAIGATLYLIHFSRKVLNKKAPYITTPN